MRPEPSRAREWRARTAGEEILDATGRPVGYHLATRERKTRRSRRLSVRTSAGALK